MPSKEFQRLQNIIKEIEASKGIQELPERILRSVGFNDNDLEALSTATSIFGGGFGGNSSQAMMPRIGAKNPLYRQLFKKKFGFDPSEQSIVRYQQEEVPYPVSQGERGGVFFSKEGYGNGYSGGLGSSEGGPNLVKDQFKPNLMYPVFRDTGFVGEKILKSHGISPNIIYKNYEDVPNSVRSLISKDDWITTQASRSGTIALSEKLAFDLLKSKGYDSVVSLVPKSENNSKIAFKLFEKNNEVINNLTTPKLEPTFGNKTNFADQTNDKVFNQYLKDTHAIHTIQKKAPQFWGNRRILKKIVDRNKIEPFNNLEEVVLRARELHTSGGFSGLSQEKIQNLANKLKDSSKKSYYPSQFIKLDRETTVENLKKYLKEQEGGKEVFIGNEVFKSPFSPGVTTKLQQLADTLYEQGMSPAMIAKQGKFKNLKLVKPKEVPSTKDLHKFESEPNFDFEAVLDYLDKLEKLPIE